jgi:membrane associated rhomboid family serine protease
MFVVPITGKISWRNPPAATVAVILINCFVFFVLQSNDSQRFNAAEHYYVESGLAEIEVRCFLDDRQTDGDTDRAAERLNANALLAYHREIETDAGFLSRLRAGDIIAVDSPEYRRWRRLRSTYENKLAQVVFMKYGFRPASPAPVTLVSYMFLHGGIGHLIGNMIFLWIVGCALELGCGRVLYLGIYLLGGIVAVLVYWLVYRTNTLPLVGASGAIAALMGAFTVLFGRKKVNIFFSLGIYFNYIKIPAIILLPVWVGNEIVRLFFTGVVQVAYVAHIGGLLGGALMGVVGGKNMGLFNADVFREEPRDDITPLLARALKHIARLEHDQGRRLLADILKRDPANLAALTHRFNLEKTDPQSPAFHAAAAELLRLTARDSSTWSRSADIYREYAALAHPPRLTPELFLRMSLVCSATGHADASRRILFALLKKKSDLPGLAASLLKLAAAYRNDGNTENWRRCLFAVTRAFPNSTEAQLAQQELARRRAQTAERPQ